jgi:hypothetical protein
LEDHVKISCKKLLAVLAIPAAGAAVYFLQPAPDDERVPPTDQPDSTAVHTTGVKVSFGGAKIQ